MIDSLLFSLNGCIPVIALLLMGFGLKRIFDENYLNRSIWLLFNILLPAKIFLDISQIKWHAAIDLHYIAVLLAGTIIEIVAIWFCGKRISNKDKRKSFCYAGFYDSYLFLGLLLLQNIYGETIPEVVPVTIVAVILYGAQKIYCQAIQKSELERLDGMLVCVLKEPMTLSLVLAIIVSSLKIELPFPVEQSFRWLRDMSNVIALLTIGACIKGRFKSGNMAFILGTSMYKLIITPILWMILGIGMGLTDRQFVVTTIAAGMPSAFNNVHLIKSSKGERTLIDETIEMTHLLFPITMILLLFLLKATCRI